MAKIWGERVSLTEIPVLFELDRCAVTLYCKWDSWISIENLFFLILDGIEACLLGEPAHGAIARWEARTSHTFIFVTRGVCTVVDGLSNAGEWLLIVDRQCKDSSWWITITEHPPPVGQAPSDI